MESRAVNVGVAVVVARLALRDPSQWLSAAAVLFRPSPCLVHASSGAGSNDVRNSVPRTTGARALVVVAGVVRTVCPSDRGT